jgi:predicted secreted hydrolase
MKCRVFIFIGGKMFLFRCLLFLLLIGSCASAFSLGGNLPSKIVFPKDERLHRSPIEWYYYTGELKTLDQKIYGIQVVIFQVIIPDQPIYYSTQTAITDIENNTHIYDTQFSTIDQFPGPSTGFDLTTGTTHIEGNGGSHKIKFKVKDTIIELQGLTLKSPTLMYGDGFKEIGNGSLFYYSYPDIPTIGTITIGESSKLVTGSLWHDHQWGTMPTNVGWDWIGLKLNDNTQLMCAEVRVDNVPTILATYIKKNGVFKKLADKDVTITTNGSWESPVTKVTYPQGWTIKVESLDLIANVTTLVSNQEVIVPTSPIPDAPTTRYWEGLCEVRATQKGKNLGGFAYVELTGY